ncbi:Kita-kyushu lung cancer antigen 1-like protein, partial [Sciurus carolinensis]|nr:Kita-kyushu lung cancer antigen 1-like protein [Sciurus carolinensis]
QGNTGETSSNSTSLALVRTSPSWSPRSNTDSLSVNNLSRDILNNFPHSIAIQKRILVNLRIVEYKLAELEHFLIIKGLTGALINQKSTEKFTRCNDSGSNH